MLLSIWSKMEKQEVLGMLKQSGSRDKDVVYTQKSTLLGVAKIQKRNGTILLVVGILASLTIIMAIIGIPMAIAGWWMRGRGIGNLEVIEATHAEFMAAL